MENTVKPERVPDGMKEISRDDFFSTVGRLDVHPYPRGAWPYVAYWETPKRELRGVSTTGPHGETELNRYFVPES